MVGCADRGKVARPKAAFIDINVVTNNNIINNVDDRETLKDLPRDLQERPEDAPAEGRDPTQKNTQKEHA